MSVEELSPRGRGAVSVLRCTGDALARLAEVAPRALALAPGELALVRVAIDGEEADEALAVATAPGVVELHLHGSPPLVARVRARLARPADGGNPGSDGGGAPADSAGGTLEQRALRALERAPSEAAARILLDQAEGALRRELARLAALPAAARGGAIDALLERSRVARRALEPARVVLAGPVNAGKSTLFNALVGAERAIVSEEQGTTRDLVEERVRLGAYPVDLVDVAGEREPAGDPRAAALERAGQAVARSERARADLVLWLEPARRGRAPPRRVVAPGVLCVALATHADRLAADDRVRGAISARDEPAAARERVAELFHAALALPEEPWSAGAAVAFEPELRERLARARASGSPADLLAALAGS